MTPVKYEWDSKNVTEIENIAYWEIDEQSFSNPHAWPIWIQNSDGKLFEFKWWVKLYT